MARAKAIPTAGSRTCMRRELAVQGLFRTLDARKTRRRPVRPPPNLGDAAAALRHQPPLARPRPSLGPGAERLHRRPDSSRWSSGRRLSALWAASWP